MLRQAFDKSRLAEEAHARQRIEADKRRKREFTRQRQDRERKEELEEKTETDAGALAMAVATSPPATAQQIAAFEADLTLYETATVEALMENDRQMTEVRAQLDALLSQAFVMEDGRRVFLTEDGTQVFDEFGVEVQTEELDPAAIPDSNPSWEEYSPLMLRETQLDLERQALINYQERLDDAREALTEGEITQAELEELETSLIEEMPDAVRAYLPEDHPAAYVTHDAKQEQEPRVVQATGPSLDGLQSFSPIGPPGT